MPARRARADQMLKGERDQLARRVRQHVLSVGGRLVEVGQVIVEDGQRVVTPDRMELTTRAGTLSVTPYAGWVACRFHDVKAAAALLGSHPATGRLNPHSGKWNFHFGRCTAEEALGVFARELAAVLPGAETAIQAVGRGADPEGRRKRQTLAEGQEATMTAKIADRLVLLREVYNAVAEAVESFEHDDRVGPDLAYLLGAMLNDTGCEWPEGRAIVSILRGRFPAGHPVFQFLHVEPE